MGPAILAGAAVQLNVFINTTFASQDPGAVSWLAYGFRFLQLPIGVFGVAIATVSTTRYADAAAVDDRTALAAHISDGLRLITFLCVPAMIGLIVLGEPIIRMVYQHGRFAPRDTAATAQVLTMYAIGLPAYAAVKILAPACYAVDRTRLAAGAAAVAIAGNLIANFVLHVEHGFQILALSTAIAAIANALILYVGIDRTIARLPHRALASHLLRIAIGAAGMGGVTWACAAFLDGAVGHHGLGARAITALVPIAIGAATYAVLTLALGVREADAIAARLRRRHQ
jgi:putative peptidoglycan lipid II flippase